MVVVAVAVVEEVVVVASEVVVVVSEGDAVVAEEVGVEEGDLRDSEEGIYMCIYWLLEFLPEFSSGKESVTSDYVTDELSKLLMHGHQKEEKCM